VNYTRHDTLVDAVDADRQSVALAEDLYTHELRTYLAVLDAERSEYASEDALAQTDQTVVRDLVATYKALGGGWESA
jgi:outer membrane protein TolC